MSSFVHPLLTKQWKESSLTSPICSFMMLLGGETTRTTTFAPFAFLLALCRVNVSEFHQRRSAKLTQCVSAKDEQKPLSVHL